MKFYQENVAVASTTPPEELLATYTGGMGLWQLIVIVFSIFLYSVSTVDRISINLALSDVNFTCIYPNGTECYNKDGTPCCYIDEIKCDNFVFHDEGNAGTLTEELKMICDKKEHRYYAVVTYRLAVIISFILIGICGDYVGLRFAGLIFISLQCLTGLLAPLCSNYVSLIVFLGSHGMFSSAPALIAPLAVCDVVGNKWRTLALGIVFLPRPAVTALFSFIYSVFTSTVRALTTISLVPVIFLVPLLFYKDSPNAICLRDYEKGEKILREIATINRHPLPPNFKLGPMHMIVGSNVPEKSPVFSVFKAAQTRRAYVALMFIWMSWGFTSNTLWSFVFPSPSGNRNIGIYGFIGGAISISLCHCIPHKIVIICLDSVKCIILGILYFQPGTSFDYSDVAKLVIMKPLCITASFASTTALYTLTPRMFPTELRCICLGFCLAIHQIGDLIERIMFYYYDVYAYGTVLVLSIVVEIVCCCFVWKVHNRELPDFLIDCVNFRMFYKPTRFDNVNEGISLEIEVSTADM